MFDYLGATCEDEDIPAWRQRCSVSKGEVISNSPALDADSLVRSPAANGLSAAMVTEITTWKIAFFLCLSILLLVLISQRRLSSAAAATLQQRQPAGSDAESGPRGPPKVIYLRPDAWPMHVLNPDGKHALTVPVEPTVLPDELFTQMPSPFASRASTPLSPRRAADFTAAASAVASSSTSTRGRRNNGGDHGVAAGAGAAGASEDDANGARAMEGGVELPSIGPQPSVAASGPGSALRLDLRAPRSRESAPSSTRVAAAPPPAALGESSWEPVAVGDVPSPPPSAPMDLVHGIRRALDQVFHSNRSSEDNRA